MKRAQRRDAISKRALLRGREDMTALHAGKVAASPILLEHEIASAMWAGFEQKHDAAPFSAQTPPVHPTARQALQDSAAAARSAA
jgi:hypothetical protein